MSAELVSIIEVVDYLAKDHYKLAIRLCVIDARKKKLFENFLMSGNEHMSVSRVLGLEVPANLAPGRHLALVRDVVIMSETEPTKSVAKRCRRSSSFQSFAGLGMEV